MRRETKDVKVLRGSFRKSRDKPSAKAPPKQQVPILKAPVWLDGHALDEWNRIVPELQGFGILAAVDQQMLANYCIAHQMRIAALKDLEEHGATMECTARDGSVTRKRNPATSVLRESMELMARFAKLFGLDPHSRGHMEIKPAQRKAEPDIAALRAKERLGEPLSDDERAALKSDTARRLLDRAVT